MPTDAEAEIRALIEERVEAIDEEDAGRLAARQASDLRAFNVLPPLQIEGKEGVDEQTRAWFDGYDGRIGYEVEDLRVTAGDDIGFCSFVYHVTGTLKEGAEVDMWVRATLGCERIDGRWLITHDHESVPFDPESGKALTNLRP